MQEKFNEKAAKSLVKPASNLAINLGFIPIVTMMPIDDLKDVRFGDDNSYRFSAEHEAGIRRGIEDYNAVGGRYHWLFSNVAINLDVVSGVSFYEKVLTVMYPGGHWKSAPCDNAAEVFSAYLKEVEGAVAAPAAKPGVLNL